MFFFFLKCNTETKSNPCTAGRIGTSIKAPSVATAVNKILSQAARPSKCPCVVPLLLNTNAQFEESAGSVFDRVSLPVIRNKKVCSKKSDVPFE